MPSREIPHGEPRESSRERAANARVIFELIARRVDELMDKDVLNTKEQAELNTLYDAALELDPRVVHKKPPQEDVGLKKAA